MAVLRVLALAAIVAASGSALAQTSAPAPHRNTIVYKCVNPDGSVIYDERPCSSDPKKVQVLDTSRALITGEGGNQGEIAASVADSDCRDQAYQRTHGASEARIAESNKHIADYRQQRERLQSQINYTGEAAADPNLVSQVQRLDDGIARESEFQQTETQDVEQAYQKALRACDAAARQRELAQAKQAPPAAAPAAPARASTGEEPAQAPPPEMAAEPTGPAAEAPAEPMAEPAAERPQQEPPESDNGNGAGGNGGDGGDGG